MVIVIIIWWKDGVGGLDSRSRSGGTGSQSICSVLTEFTSTMLFPHFSHILHQTVSTPFPHISASVPPTSSSSSLLWTQSIINFCPIELERCPWGRPPAKTVFCRGLNQLNKGRGGGWLTAKFPLTTQFGYQRIGPRAVLWTLLKFIYFFKWVFIHIALISTSPVVVVRQVNRTVHNDAL